MGRLIDVDKISFRCSYSGDCMASDDKCEKCSYYVYDYEEIQNQPTAYNVDNVVAELEERTVFLKNCTKYGNENAEQQEKSYSTMMMYEIADLVDDLIDIVRKGGVE